MTHFSCSKLHQVHVILLEYEEVDSGSPDSSLPIQETMLQRNIHTYQPPPARSAQLKHYSDAF